MSRYLQIGVGEPSDLSSNAGWSQFIEWVNGLDAEEYPALAEFSATGQTEHPQLVADQIEAAEETYPPDADTKGITETLREYMDGETEAASVV